LIRLATYLLAAFLALPATAQTVRIGTDGAYAPYSMLDGNGTLTGFDIDLGNALCVRATLECEWVVTDWETILDQLGTGRFDAVMAGMANTLERRKSVSFSIGYQQGETTAAYAGLAVPDNFDTTTVAVQVNTKHAEILTGLGKTPHMFSTFDAAINAVLDGRADLVFASYNLLKDHEFLTGFKLRVVRKIEIDPESTAIAFRKSDTALRNRFDAAILEMGRDGSLDRLLEKWFAEKIAT
jgi:polar amino acid transport system substrate-binding protein